MKRYLRATVSSLALAATFSLAQAGAAAAQAAEGAKLDEVVVTAQFRSENLQKTPLAITAVNAAQLEARSYNNILDVAQSAPNVNLTQGGGGFGSANFAFVRGIGQPDFSFAFEPRVGFYIDDVYYSTVYGSIFDLLDVERVEILRGPQGVLNGRNSVGGAIRLFTQKPKGGQHGYVEATGGRFSRRDVKGAVDVTVIPDKLFVRASAGEMKRDGHVTRQNFACLYPSLGGTLPGLGRTGGDCEDGTLGGVDRYSAKVQVRFTPTDNIENNFSVDYGNDKSESPATTLLRVTTTQDPLLAGGFGVPAGTPNGLALWLANQGRAYGLTNTPALLAALQSGPYKSYAIFADPGLTNKDAQTVTPNISGVEAYGWSNVFDMDLPGQMHFKSITAYRGYTGAFGSSVSALAVPVQEVTDYVSHHQFSQEARLLGTLFNGRVEWTVGGFYLDSYSLNRAAINAQGFAIYVAARNIGEIQSLFLNRVDDSATLTNVSGYGNAVVHVTDKLTVTAGVRYSEETKDYDYNEQLIGSPRLVVSAPTTKIDRTDPRIAVQYQFAPTLQGYVSYSTGFTAGGYNPRPFVPGDVNLTLEPEDVSAYEVGFKSELFDRRVRLNLAAYFTQYKNIQMQLAGCPVGCVTTSPIYYGNGGDAEIKGFEAELQAQPIHNLLINASTGYTDFEYTRIAPSANPRNDPGGLTLGSPQTFTPEWTANAGVQYKFELGRWGQLTPRLDYTYRSTIYFRTDRTDPYSTQNAYSLANARLTWSPPDSNWMVAAFVTNLTNKLYYTTKQDQLNQYGAATGTVAPPREWGVTVRRSF